MEERYSLFDKLHNTIMVIFVILENSSVPKCDLQVLIVKTFKCSDGLLFAQLKP